MIRTILKHYLYHQPPAASIRNNYMSHLPLGVTPLKYTAPTLTIIIKLEVHANRNFKRLASFCGTLNARNHQ